MLVHAFKFILMSLNAIKAALIVYIIMKFQDVELVLKILHLKQILIFLQLVMIQVFLKNVIRLVIFALKIKINTNVLIVELDM